ncbi:MAG: efflux RND transporter permease subunit [Acidobacteriota bacterium]
MQLADFSIRRPIATYVIMATTILLGIISFTRLPVDLMPDVSFPTLSVRTAYPGVGPEEIERLITEPIEKSLASAPGVEHVTSTSSEGSSQVRVAFEWGTDLDEAADEVRTRLDRVRGALPDESEPPFLFKFDVSQFPIMFLGISGDMDPRRLRQVAEEEVQYRLERVPGVAATDIQGGFRREIHVRLSLDKVKALNLSLEQVLASIRGETLNLPAGQLKEDKFEILLRTQGEFTSVDEIRDLVLTTRGGIPLLLRDVATIEDSHEEVRGMIRIDGKPGIRMSVRKQSGSNTVEVAEAVHREMEQINREVPGVQIWSIIDSSRFIKQSINNVRDSAFWGSLLAIGVLFLFLRNIRSTIIIGISIPISVIATFALMYFYGFTLNTVSFGGLALGVGMLVDNAIVILENIFRHREAGMPRAEAALVGTREVGTAIVASTLTSVAVFVPLVFLGGMSGILFKEMAWVVAFVQFFSLFVALTLVPMLCAKYLKMDYEIVHNALSARLVRVSGRVLDGLDSEYQKAIHWALRHRKTVVLSAIILFFGSLALIPFIGVEMEPETDEGEVRVGLELPAGTGLEETDRVTLQVEKILRESVPETEHMLSEIGGSGGGFGGPSTVNTSSIRLKLVDKSKRSRSTMAVASDLRGKLSGIPGVIARPRAGGGNFALRRGQQTDDRLSIEVRGHDLVAGQQLALKVRRIAEEVDGVSDAIVTRREGRPEMRVHVDRARASAMGISVAQVATTLRTAVGGTRAAYFRDAGDEYNILVRFGEADRDNIESVVNLPISTPTGETVPLASVVRLERTEGPMVIERKDQERIITVAANLDGRDMGSVMGDLIKRLEELQPLPAGFVLIHGAEYEEQQKAFRDLIMTLILAIVLVYLVMAAQFESLKYPFLIMFSVPLAAVGVVLALFLTETTFNMQAFIGVIMLAGIVVNNAIVLVDYVNHMRFEQGHSLAESVEIGSRRRLRPILLTTLTTCLGLVPMALGVGEGSELQAPMARVVIGGMISSTLITLIFIPTLYTMFEGRRARVPEEQLAPEAGLIPEGS